ncbi:MAG: RluA family pseudouridine synthase [Clostridia bacterium]|nr:RluA family pseudouridine synthase [Clostridia bacterium]
MRELHIGKNDAGRRLDRVVHAAFPNLPTTVAIKAIRTKNIKRNGKRCEPGDRLVEGDVLALYLPDELLERPAAVLPPTHLPPPEILYEDANILLAEKPQGLVVHEDDRGTQDTLIARIQGYLAARGEYDPAAENTFAPALANRIDRNTCGIVIAAKNAEALRILSDKIRDREIDKYYLCAVLGRPTPASGTLKCWLRKDERDKTVRHFNAPQPGARTALTEYETLQTVGNASLLRCRLLTGRTHQIRVSLASVGCPLLGDGKYGDYEENRRRRMHEQALCAYKLRFSFTTPAGILAYLNGREFTVRNVPFVESLGFDRVRD